MKQMASDRRPLLRGERGRRAFVACLLSALTAFGAAASRAGPADVKVDKLSNGLTVLTMPNTWNRIVAVCILVDAGSKHDPADKPGLARLTNDLLVRGTVSMSEPRIAEAVDAAGIGLGTLTTEDFAEVYMTAIDTQWPLALRVLADALANPAFDNDKLLDTQRRALASFSWSLEDPLERCAGRVQELLFGEHPYASPASGTPQGIERITRDDVVRFHVERYRAEDTVIAVVGNFDRAEALTLVKELFADYAAGGPPTKELPPVVRRDPRSVESYADVPIGCVWKAYLAPAPGTDDYVAARILAAALGDGAASRLSEGLIGRGGIAEAAEATYSLLMGEGAILLSTSTVDVDRAIEVIDRETERLKTEPLTSEELERARNRVAGRIAATGQRNVEQAARLAWSQLAGLGPGFTEGLLRDLKRVDAGSVRRAASKYLVDPVTVIVRPGRPSRAGV